MSKPFEAAVDTSHAGALSLFEQALVFKLNLKYSRSTEPGFAHPAHDRHEIIDRERLGSWQPQNVVRDGV